MKHRRYKHIYVPLFILCVLASVSSFSLFHTPQSDLYVQQMLPDLKLATEFLSTNKPTRKIASINSEKNKISFDCEKSNSNLSAQSNQVYIEFKNCALDQKTTEFKLVNQTNQYMAQLFHTKKNIYATDFIQLANGENILKLEISLNGKQKKTEIIKIQRVFN